MWQPLGKVGGRSGVRVRRRRGRAPSPGGSLRGIVRGLRRRRTDRCCGRCRRCGTCRRRTRCRRRRASSRFAAICLPLAMILSATPRAAPTPPTGDRARAAGQPARRAVGVALTTSICVGIDAEPGGDDLLVRGHVARCRMPGCPSPGRRGSSLNSIDAVSGSRRRSARCRSPCRCRAACRAASLRARRAAKPFQSAFSMRRP